MKLLSRIILVVVLAVVLSAGYVATAIFTAESYDNLSLKTSYTLSHYQQKVAEAGKGLLANPAQPLLVKLSAPEVEGLMQLAARDYKMVKGLKITLEKNLLVAQVNLALGGWEKGVEIAGKPVVTGTGQLQLAIEEFKVGKFRLPVTPGLLVLKSVLPPGIVELEAPNTLGLVWENAPFQFERLTLEPGTLTVGLVVSPQGLLQMAAKDKTLVQAVVAQAASLKRGVQSPAATSLIESIQQKQEIKPEDVEQARSIYKNLSAEDRANLQKNMGSLLQDPAMQKLLKQYGIKP